jgi:hypothetical protein
MLFAYLEEDVDDAREEQPEDDELLALGEEREQHAHDEEHDEREPSEHG